MTSPTTDLAAQRELGVPLGLWAIADRQTPGWDGWRQIFSLSMGHLVPVFSQRAAATFVRSWRFSVMSLLLIIILLFILFGGGLGFSGYGGRYGRFGGFGLGGILIIVLIVLLLTGRL